MSRKIIYFVALASITSLLSSCNDSQEAKGLSNKAITFASGVGNYNSRVSQEGNQWSAGDQIGITMLQSGTQSVLEYANIPYRAEAAAQTTVFQPVGTTITYPEVEQAVDFMAYYPYMGELSDGSYPINLADQSASLVAHDLLYATANNQGNGYLSGSVAFGFTHQLAKLRLKFVDESNQPLAIDAHSIAIEGMHTTAQFSFASATLEQQATVTSITPYLHENSYEAILLPFTMGAGHQVSITVAGIPYLWKMDATHAALEIKAGTAYTFKVTVKTSEAEIEAVLVNYDGSSIAPWGDGGADNQEKEVVDDLEIPADYEQIEVAMGGSISAALASASTAKVAILLESAATYEEAGSLNVPASVKSLMIVGKSGVTPPSFYLHGNLILAADIDLIHLYNLELHGRYGDSYFMNQSTKVALGAVIIQSSIVRDVRGILRLRSGCTMESYKIVNSIVYNINNYNLLSLENESGATTVELSKSTFYNLSSRGLYLNSAAAPSSVLIDQCTFNQGPMYAVAQFSSAHKGAITFTNTIMGLPYSDARGISVWSNAESTTESGNYYVSDTVWNGTPVGQDCGKTASALFADPAAGDFTQSAVQAGDPRWYK